MPPDTSKLSKYLRVDGVKDGDVIEFVDAGKIYDKTFERNGEKEIRPILEITVKIRGEQKTYSPNGTTLKMLNKEWGTATEKWVGKKASLTILPASNGKDMIVAKPVGSRDDQDAQEE